MNDDMLLSRLRDIRLPQPPVADPAWDIWLAALVTAAALLIFWFGRRRQQSSWQHEALSALRRISSDDQKLALLQIATIVRRVARVLDHPEPEKPRSSTHSRLATSLPVHRQSGHEYLTSLDKLFGTSFFSNGPGKILGDDLYRPVTDRVDTATLANAIAELIDKHQAPKGRHSNANATRHSAS